NEGIDVGFGNLRIQIEGVLRTGQIVKARWSIEAQSRYRVTRPIRIRRQIMHRTIKLTHGQKAYPSSWPWQFPSVDQTIQGGQGLHQCSYAGSVVMGALL